MILEPDADGTVFRFFEVTPESELPSVDERRTQWEARLTTLSDEERAAAVALRPDISRHPMNHCRNQLGVVDTGVPDAAPHDGDGRSDPHRPHPGSRHQSDV